MAEVILLRRDADDNARVAAQLSAENSHRFDALNQTAVAVVCAVAPASGGNSGAASSTWGPTWAGAGVLSMVVLSRLRVPRRLLLACGHGRDGCTICVPLTRMTSYDMAIVIRC